METQIKELMGLVENFGEKRLLMYLYRTDKNFRVAEDDSFSARQTIETKLRAMLESSAVAEREACAKVLDVRVEILDKEAKKQRRGGDVIGIGGEMEAAAASCEAAAYEIRARSIGGE